MVRLGLAVVAAAMLVAGVGGLVLAWDGAWFVLRTLETGTPTFLHGRVTSAAVQAPALIAGMMTGDATVATLATGLSYAVIPFLALLATWRVTRPDRDVVLALAALGILVTALPGRAFLISEAMVAVDLAWPLMAAAALGRLERHRLLVAVVALAAGLAHPFGAVLVVLALGVAWVRGRVATGEERGVRPSRWLGALAVALVVVAVGRTLALSPGYEASTFDLARLADHVRGGLGPRPLGAVTAAFLAAVAVAVVPKRHAILGLLTAVVMLAAALVVLIPWAADAARWERALQFRTLALPVQLPMLALMVLTALRPEPDADPGPDPTSDTQPHPVPSVRPLPARIDVPGLTIVAAGLVAVAVLAAQTLTWRAISERAMSAVEAASAGCVAGTDLPIERTALRHWGLTSLALLHEAPAPRHLVLARPDCAAVDASGGVPIKVLEGAVVDRVPPDGPLDLRPLADILGGG